MDTVCTIKIKIGEKLIESKAKDSNGMAIKRRAPEYELVQLLRDNDSMRYYYQLDDRYTEISDDKALSYVRESLLHRGRSANRIDCVKYLTQNVKP